jgi:hypothetical protein
MVAHHYPTHRQTVLADGDLALREARDRLGAARDAFQRAGRADVSAAIGSAIAIVREVELSLLAGLDSPRPKAAADWFLD